jgi:sugar lactone lactonase YvrE
VASTRIGARRSVITTLVVASTLALIFGALVLAYIVVTRPAVSADTTGQQDRRFLFSIYGFEGDLLRRPTGVGIDANGSIMVADTGKRRIVVFDGNGNFVTTYGDPGKGETQLWQPIDVAAAPDGRSYVVDKGEKKIVLFDANRRAIKAVKFKEEAPTSVTVANDQLFVTTESGVVIGGLDGTFVTGYIKRGKNPGEFDRPAGVAVGADGTLYVCDSLNYRIQALDTDGKVKWVYGKPLPADQAVNYNGPDRKFGLPSSLALDGVGNLYVVDGLSSEIIVLDSAGKFIEKFGDVGHADGTFYYPDGIDYANGRIVVADKFNDRIEVFSTPTSPNLADTARLNWPWLLLLLAVPLAALPFLRRGSRYVASPEFVERLGSDERGQEVARVLKRVNASAMLAAGQSDADLPISWLKRETKADEVRDLMATFGLEQADAESLAVAMKLRGKTVLLTDKAQLEAAAATLDLKTLGFDELADALGLEPDAGEGDGGGESDAE